MKEWKNIASSLFLLTGLGKPVDAHRSSGAALLPKDGAVGWIMLGPLKGCEWIGFAAVHPLENDTFHVTIKAQEGSKNPSFIEIYDATALPLSIGEAVVCPTSNENVVIYPSKGKKNGPEELISP